jgi:ABC-type sugar transport system permease subunit
MQSNTRNERWNPLESPLGLVIGLATASAGTFATLRLIGDGLYPFASITTAVTAFLFLIMVKKSLSPYRWLATGMVLAALFTVYPIFYTFYLSFTSMGGGHLLTKQQAISRFMKEKFVPDDAMEYDWTAYTDAAGSYLLVVQDADGALFVARPGKSLEPLEGAEEPPESIDGFTMLDSIQAVQKLEELAAVSFGDESAPLTVQALGVAAVAKTRYSYDATADVVTDLTTGTGYRPVDGTYVSASGEKLIPGFITGVGAENYTRFLANKEYYRPAGEIILWSVAFAFFSVLFSFLIGLVISILFEDLPGKRIIRALLIIPYPIPVLVSLLVWRGLLNEQMGLVTNLLRGIFGSAPLFFNDIFWARFALILINVYLTYPYFYVISSGALKAIPRDLYEAADIDGAGPYWKLKSITLPMLMRILMPLVIASFCFTFNNFTVVWGFNAGLPAMADTIVPMGHTDLLISFIYRLGFNSTNAAEYGFTAAVTVILFIFVGAMVFLQTVNTKALKEAD